MLRFTVQLLCTVFAVPAPRGASIWYGPSELPGASGINQLDTSSLISNMCPSGSRKNARTSP